MSSEADTIPTPPAEAQPSFESPRKEKIQDANAGTENEQQPPAAPVTVPSPASILSRLRELLATAEVDAFIVGSADAHQSEYVSDSESRRQFISGFSGSAGTALVTQDQALLWTDGRYFLQASTELSSDWILMRQGDKGVPDLNDWLVQNLSKERTVGVDSSLMTSTAATALEAKLKAAGVRLIGVDRKNPVDQVWEELGDKPARPTAKARVHPLEHAGVSHTEKLSKVRETLVECNADGIIFSMLDEVVWLYNIRGADVTYNPVSYSFAYVTVTSAILFIDLDKVADIALEGVEYRPYEEVEDFLKAQSEGGKTVLADSNQLNWRLVKALGKSHKEKSSPITLAKSIKNSAEIKGLTDAHLRDGLALTAFLAWLENQVQAGAGITEYHATEVLESYRAKMDKNVGLSFSTIAGYGPNGAIIHYRPSEKTSAVIGTDSLFLLDSGGQYLDGTTDTTRTLHFGTPDEKMKRCYTQVLKGQIALSRVTFPVGTLGSRLDTLARMHLWAAGLDFNHGTGHGVGAFLNVHEGPQGISFRFRPNETGFQRGMTTSNEPGYYEEGNFGIRIEDVCVTVDADVPNNFGEKGYCCFQTLTMVPKSTKLVDLGLIDDSELAYLNDYNMTVRNSLLAGMEASFPEAVPYLMKETEPLTR